MNEYTTAPSPEARSLIRLAAEARRAAAGAWAIGLVARDHVPAVADMMASPSTTKRSGALLRVVVRARSAPLSL